MAAKTHVSQSNLVEPRFGSWVKQVVDLVAPKNLAFIGGRGTAKTTDILADRTQEVCYSMPRSMQILMSDTYVNNLTNTVPGLLEGWRERKGWIEGVHWVTDERPPAHFKIPYKPIVNYKHTISIYNGCFYNLGSLDRVSSLAGGSYQHVFGDEVKFFQKKKLNKLMPARRGFLEVSSSPYYRGSTFITDMPNVLDGEHDWIFEYEDLMDKEQVTLALRCGVVVSDIRKEIFEAYNKGQKDKVASLQKNLTRWIERWYQVRKDLTFFYMVSSFANADILQVGYYKDVLESDGIEVFKSSILSLRPDVKKGEKFYGNLGEQHYYEDGVNNEYYDRFDLQEKIEQSSLALKYIDHNKPLDGGMDFGDMCSLVLGQELGSNYYVLKNMYTLAPQSSKELAAEFIAFFKHHKKKILNLYYDRSANQYQNVGRDWAGEVKDFIEKMGGVETGWTVNLMSRGQSNITHDQEYRFMKSVMGAEHARMPRLRIDKFQCRQLLSSLNISKIKMRRTSSGANILQKDKSSEKLPLNKLPMYSTNFSDAFKYLMYRPLYVKIFNRSSSRARHSDPTVI